MTSMITCLLATCLSFQYDAPVTRTPQLTATDISSQMPKGAIMPQLGDSRLWQFSIDIGVNTLQTPNNERPFRMPLITEGPWSRLSIQSLEVISANGNDPVSMLEGNTALKGSGIQGEKMIQAPLANGPQRFSTISISAEVDSWNSKVNEEMAAMINWPAEWPSEAKAALLPQVLIESDEQIFKDALQSLFGPNLRLNRPWVVAKAITQYTCTNIRVTGARMMRAGRGQLRGLNVQGALATSQSGIGSRADLTCVCVAMLRAAGIPARPVIGLSADVESGDELTTWAEFYLPDSGWVPFSPWEMQKSGVRSWKIDRSWRYFGNWSDLNNNIPLSWSFAPGDGSTAHDTWALWGWTRAVPGVEFPIPNPGKGRAPGNQPVQYTPSGFLAKLRSGGTLNLRKMQQWLSGETRPVHQRTRSR